MESKNGYTICPRCLWLCNIHFIFLKHKRECQLLQRACDGAREGNSSINQQVRDNGNEFLNSVEISAQEAVYTVLQLQMR